MSDNKKILLNYLLYFLCFLSVIVVGISRPQAVSITDYATKYYYYSANDNSSTTSTDYRTGSSNRVTLDGATAPTYANGEGFNGFYNRINYSLTKGSIYTLSLTVSYNGVLSSEFSQNTINNRLLNTDFAHCSNCTITAVSGNIREYNSTNQSISNAKDYVVHMSYTFVATSSVSQFYLGSYTGDDRTFGLDNHQSTVVVIVASLDISNDNSSTIINQNDTIISQNNQIIEQNNQNTQDIINNNNTNTDNIINNNNINTNKMIEDNKKNFQSCVESKNIFDLKSYLTTRNVSYTENSDGSITFTTSPSLINQPFQFSSVDTIVSLSGIVLNSTATNFRFELLNSNNEVIANMNGTTINKIENKNSSKLRMSWGSGGILTLKNIQLELGSISTDYVPYGEEICVNKLDVQTNAINDLNDSLNDDDSFGATSEASEFFGSFTTNTFGLTSIITAPLNLIQSLTSSSCSELHLPLPYLNNKYLDLPCMTSIYQSHFGAFFTMYQTITYGIIAYWVCVRIFNQVKDFKNPEHDEIEVVDL